MLSVKFWGDRGSIPCPGPATVKYGGNTSCLEIRADGRLVIVDFGTGIKPLGDWLMANDVKKNGPLDADIFITHTHWDHIMGFPMFTPIFIPGTKLRIQEFMVAPVGAPTFAEALRTGVEVYHSLKKKLKDAYGVGAVNIGDEGGFAPPVDTTDQALDIIVKAIEAAGYVPGKDVCLAMDAAASEFYENGVYTVDGKSLSPGELVDFYADLKARYPLISLEDPVMEDDFATMAAMTERMGRELQLVGDDLFVTNPERLKKGIEAKAGNALLLKVNQIGTVSEAMEAAALAKRSGYAVMVSHRSGESEDTSIADIAVALECGQIKAGAPARGERTAKYNRLLRIEERLGANAVYAGRSAFRSGD